MICQRIRELFLPTTRADRAIRELTPEVIRKYRTTVATGPEWVAFKNPQYDPWSASKKAARFNLDDQHAFYVASGVGTAQREVPGHHELEMYTVKSGEITSFDLPAFARDYGIEDVFVRTREDGGYPLCQRVASIVTSNDPTVSGIIYNSAQRHQLGEKGFCLVVLPSGNLPADFFTKAQQ